MLTTESLFDEWVKTRDRINEQIEVLREGLRISLVGGDATEVAALSLTLLLRWREELDVLNIELLMTSVKVQP